MQDGSRKAIIAAFFANLGIALAKFAGFLVTGSAGLAAESVHSLADTGNQGLLMLGSKRGQRPADRAHPFGYGPERYFWAFVVALVLFSLGGLFALYEGIQKVSHPHELSSPVVAFVILGVSIALETYSLRTAMKEAARSKGSRTWWNYIRTAKSPELPVVLLEDIGAEVGLLVAFLGLVMAEVTGDARWDAAGSIAIGVLLVVIAVVLAIEMKGLLVGEAASDEQQTAIEDAINSSPHVTSLIHVRTQHLGPDRILVAAKVEFSTSLDIRGLAEAIDETERRMREGVGLDMIIYLEPDIRRTAAT